MSFFSKIFGGGAQAPTKLNTVTINQSVLGFPLPVVMGCAPVQQSLLWVDGLNAKAESAGGKGIGGGGKGATSYLYTADVIAGLCNGPIEGVGDVWSGQSWLSNSSTSESYTVSGGTPSYAPSNASAYGTDIGVSTPVSYSGSYDDVAGPGATVLSGTDNVSFQKVAYGSSLASGQYSVDPATNTYYFSTADNGKTVTLSYSFNIQYIKQQVNSLIPSGKTVSVGGTYTFKEDDGCVYVGGPNDGLPLTKVSGTPTATGTYSVSGSGPATYHFATGDIAAEVRITYKIQNASIVPQGASTTLAFSMFEGFMGQALWSFLTSTFPSAALAYTGVSYVAYNPMTLGASTDVQQNKFEVLTPEMYGSGILDCNPVLCMYRVLTNAVWGLGAGAVPFPASAIDNSSDGTWGTGVPGARTVNGSAWNWFAANSFFISPVIDHQDTAASLMSKWLEAGMCAAFMSEGLLKLVPYGDTSCAGNGATWTAPSEFAAAVDDTCFLKKDGADTVKISCSPWQDAFNVVQIQWNNRASQYSSEITQEWDQAARNRYGDRIEDPQTYEFIHTLPAAAFAGSMRVKRGVYNRNTYGFSLPYNYAYLEPMDVLYITTSSQWAAGLNNANLSIVNVPVRILKIVDNPGEEGLVITAEEYPFGAHEPVIYNKDIQAGQTQQNLYADPGDSEVVMFEATDELTGFQGFEVWIGATGVGDEWGKTVVYVSQDGTKYLPVGECDQPARLGELNATFASGSDPDTTNSLVVDLVENSAQLESGTTTDADSGNTLCFCDGEIIAYSAATVTDADQYTMDTYIRRGLMGSAMASHATSSLFMRLDDAVFRFKYDPQWAGQTLYFKFQSVNKWGNSAQDLSTLTPVMFTLPGDNPGTVDASSGLVLVTNPPGTIRTGPPIGRGPLGWTPLTNLVKWIAQAVAASPWWAIVNDTVNNFSFSITGGSPNTLTPNAASVQTTTKGSSGSVNASLQSGSTMTQPTKLINGNGSTADGNQTGTNSGTGTITLGFTPTIPAGAIVTGVVVQWTAGAEPGGSGTIITALTAGGSSKSVTVPRNYVLYTLGGSTDLWGCSLSPSSSYGITLENTGAQTWIFNAKMTVYYTTVSGDNWAASQTFAGTGSGATFLGTGHTMIGQEPVQFDTAVACHFSSMSGDGGYMRVGLSTGGNMVSGTDSYVAFYAHKVASSPWGNWQLLVCDGVHPENQIDSGIALVDAARAELTFTISEDGSLVTFLINGVSAATVSTNLPTASMGLCFNYLTGSGNLAFRFEELTLSY